MVPTGFLDGKMSVCNHHATGMALWFACWIQGPEGTDNQNIQTCGDSSVLDFHLSTAASVTPGTSLFCGAYLHFMASALTWRKCGNRRHLLPVEPGLGGAGWPGPWVAWTWSQAVPAQGLMPSKGKA